MTTRLISLKSENVKRLKAVEITFPEGQNVTRIKGRNRQGKTSILDSILYAIGGKSTHPDKPIRSGEKKAEVVLDIGDFVITRSWTEKDSYLTVTTTDGAKYPSPQKILDGLFNNVAFDPLAFLSMERRKQFETLRTLVGVDISDLEAKRKIAYDNRTDTNRRAAQMKTLADDITVPDDTPDELQDIGEAMKELERVQETEARIAQNTETVAHLHSSKCKRDEYVESMRRRIKEIEADIEQQLAHARTEIDTQQRLLRENEELAKTLPEYGVQDARGTVESVELVNRDVRAKQMKAKHEAEAERLSGEAEQYSEEIKQIDAEKAKRIAEAKFPVEGLAFEEGVVTYNGLPLDQASGAEQLNVSVAVACAMAPRLKLMLVRDGSLLDADSMALLKSLAEQHGAQVLVETVATDDDTAPGVLIEDGEVKRIDP